MYMKAHSKARSGISLSVLQLPYGSYFLCLVVAKSLRSLQCHLSFCFILLAEL